LKFSRENTLREIISIKNEFSSLQFVATVFIKKKGLIIDIAGPNEHLGGIGVGIPYIRKNGEESANYHCISIPSHRDGELAGRIARNISKVTRCHTVVIVGINLPDITKNQLNELIRFFEKWSISIGKKIVNQLSSNSNKPIL
jgi:hypothetical protein